MQTPRSRPQLGSFSQLRWTASVRAAGYGEGQASRKHRPGAGVRLVLKRGSQELALPIQLVEFSMPNLAAAALASAAAAAAVYHLVIQVDYNVDRIFRRPTPR